MKDLNILFYVLKWMAMIFASFQTSAGDDSMSAATGYQFHACHQGTGILKRYLIVQ